MARLREFILKYRQFLLYCVVGAANTLITLFLFYILDKINLQYILASIIAYGAGIINGYIWSTRSVFKTKGTAQNFAKFIVVNLVAIALNSLLIYLFVDKVGIHPKILAQALVTPFTFIANYSLNKLWTFSDKKR